MQLWNNYGITSYNLGCSGGSIPVSYWMMRNAVKYHKPKIAVLDLFYTESNSKIEGTKEFLHDNYDVYPISLIKIKTVMDLYDGDFNSQFELLFPFSVYHTRWNEMDSDMLNRILMRNLSYNKEKGANSYTGVAIPNNMVLVPETEILDEKTLGLKYIQMFIDFCKSENIEPVLVNVPYIASERSQKAANSAVELAKKNNVRAVNMQYAGIVNYNTDMRDSWSHLNPSGEYKVTEYLGRFFINNFELTDKRNSAEGIQWNSWYKEYYNFLVEQLDSVDNYKDMLMLLSNENFFATL